MARSEQDEREKKEVVIKLQLLGEKSLKSLSFKILRAEVEALASD
jgi:hypothetical protein